MSKHRKHHVPIGAAADMLKMTKFPTPAQIGYIAEKGKKVPRAAPENGKKIIIPRRQG